jgi:hypothetical protein
LLELCKHCAQTRLISFSLPSFFSLLDKTSSSVAHLVENELPLASVIVPSTSSTSTIDKRTRLSQSNITSVSSINDVQDVNEIVPESSSSVSINIVNNNSSTSSGNIIDQQKHGSYNNLLYRENANESETEKGKKRSGGGSSGADVTQNVYSNIPPSSPAVPSILKNAASDHVYSNIDETVNGGNGYISTLDLDLDDPLDAFIKKKEIPNSNNQQSVYSISTSSSSSHALPIDSAHTANKMILPSISSSSSTTGTQITSIELKNVLNAVALQKSSNQINEVPVTIGPALRQETMIDTALDLDSLDSQVGLMNKTIV